MRKRILLMITVVLMFSSHLFATGSHDNWPDVSGPYLGQEPPGLTAEIFAPGIVSTDGSEINSVFTPDRDEFYFTTWTQESGTKILVTSQVDGRWIAPQVASFDESYLIVSIYGRDDGLGEGDLYISFRNPDGLWSPLKNMGGAINSEKRDFCPMVTPDGKYLFFSSKLAGEGDIFWVDAKIIEVLRAD